MDNRTILSALAWEARRRGVGYGVLCAALREGEQEKILRAYRQEEKLRRKKQAQARRQTAPPSRANRLNTREAAALLAQGLSDEEIARRLEVSPKTIAGWKRRTGQGETAQPPAKSAAR